MEPVESRTTKAEPTPNLVLEPSVKTSRPGVVGGDGSSLSWMVALLEVQWSLEVWSKAQERSRLALAALVLTRSR